MAEPEFPLDLLDSRAPVSHSTTLPLLCSLTQPTRIERFCCTENTAESPSSEVGSKSLLPEADIPVWRDQRK